MTSVPDDRTATTHRSAQPRDDLADAVAEFADLRSRDRLADAMLFAAARPDVPGLLAALRERGMLASLDETKLSAGDLTSTVAAEKRPPTDTTAGVAFPGYDHPLELSRGGQGVVYRAMQVGTRREVAIKVLLHGEHASDSVRRRFEREIELAAALQHPSIVTIFHSGTTTSALPFYVMDFVRGLPLNRFTRDKGLRIDGTVELFIKLCEAVAYAHQRGVIHRDLKPSNILVDERGDVKILDFGLAKRVNREDELTLSDEVMGTLAYMSPEQTRGKRDEIDTRSDIYALGVILFELVTGEKPYPVSGSILEILRNINETPPASPSSLWTLGTGAPPMKSRRPWRSRTPIDRDLETILLKTLDKQPARRYQSAGELAADLQRWLRSEPIEARRDSSVYWLLKMARKHVGVSVTLVSLVMLVVAFSIVVAFLLFDERLARVRSEHSARKASELADERNETILAAINVRARDRARYLLEAVRQSALPIAEWVANENPPMRACYDYLTGVEPDAARLRSALGPANEALARLMEAERAALRGDETAAIAAYRYTAETPKPHWAEEIARQRLMDRGIHDFTKESEWPALPNKGGATP
ncbi:MAG: serine/threonine-protein kinase [Phycisphaerae bacterium]